jgi:hypothetical protein
MAHPRGIEPRIPVLEAATVAVRSGAWYSRQESNLHVDTRFERAASTDSATGVELVGRGRLELPCGERLVLSEVCLPNSTTGPCPGVGIEPRRAHFVQRTKVTFPRAPLQSRKVGFPDSGFGLGFHHEAFPRQVRLKCSLTCTPTHSGLPRGSSCKSWLLRLPPLTTPGRQVPRAPLPGTSVIHARAVSCTTSKGITPSSSLLRAHAPNQLPPPEFVYPHSSPEVFAGCCEPLLETGSSRRYLCKSFPGCLSH